MRKIIVLDLRSIEKCINHHLDLLNHENSTGPSVKSSESRKKAKKKIKHPEISEEKANWT